MFGFTAQGPSAGRAKRSWLAEGHGGAVSSPIRRVRRSAMVMALAAALGVTALSMSMQTSTAAASSQGCTYTSFPFDYVCFDIVGTGTSVAWFSVIRGRLQLDGVCNFKVRVRVTAPNGDVWTFRSGLREGCEIGRAKVNVLPGSIGPKGINPKSFPSGSRACGTFYENGVIQDTACNKIHS